MMQRLTQGLVGGGDGLMVVKMLVKNKQDGLDRGALWCETVWLY